MLRVVGRRPDGYHDIRSWMVPLDLADRLRLDRRPRGIELEVSGAPELAGRENLVYRAAWAFRRRFGRPAGVRLALEKRIPIAAGLGGGSSDAAATLRGLARLEGIDDPASLRALAAELGSDVPFFLGRGAAWISGRGEQVQPAPAPPPCWLLLVKPPFGIRAAEAYAAWRPPPGGVTLTAPGAGANWTDPWRELPGLRTAKGLGGLLGNDLQPGVLRKYPRLRSVLGRLAELAPLGVLMSGSGSTCFAVFADRDRAEKAAGAFRRRGSEELLLARPIASQRRIRALPTS